LCQASVIEGNSLALELGGAVANADVWMKEG